MFITFCMPFSNMDFAFIFDGLFSIVGCSEPRFLLENKQFGAFHPFSQRYNKSMILVSVLARFLKGFWYTIGIFVLHIFWHRIWDALFPIFGSFWAIQGDFFTLLDQNGSPRGIQKHSARSPFWHSGAAPRPEASKLWLVALETSPVALKTDPVQRATAHFLTDFDRMLKRFWIHLGCIWYGFGIDILSIKNNLE